ncbi:DGQHR domain-containing protein [Aequorivita sinensis]|uniref:DGQHR domain-containing protein n=1 Tax=Aequorivita sinensis TaxID=1382458 RepID=UPI0023008B63|nr:DGQHR domain-containing protein [Aequorivita sinensis]
MEIKPIISDFIKVKQPLGDFYIGKIRFEDLLDIAFADVRRIEKDEQTGYESYFGIQRKLASKRVKEISEYVTTLDAAFPSSILLAIDEYSIESDDFEETEQPNVSFDKQLNKLTIRRKENIAHIIDGQHRVFGLKKAIEDNGLFSQTLKDFELVVTIFVNMDDENQALMFSTINKAHTKVNKSLVYDLFDLASTRSPQRVAHNIVKLLNEKEDSPFQDRVKMLGFAEDNSKEIITQATLAELILKYISKNPMLDRDFLKRGKKLQRFNGKNATRYFLRDWFIDKEDAKIAKLIWNYFKAVENKWSIAWGDSEYILTKSTGIIALMRFLKDIVIHIGTHKLISIDEFESIFKKINISDVEFINDNFKAGGVGQSDLYKDLKSKSGIV